MKAIERDLTIAEALDLGAAMSANRQYENAVGLFKGVLIHEPENLEAIERLGAALFELKRVEEALYYFWRGMKINRRHPMALTNYGLALGQLGHWEESVPYLERAIAQAEKPENKAPGEVKALCNNNLGNTLEKLKRYKEALTVLDKGIAYNPVDPFPRYNRGIVLLRLNRQREAINELSSVLAINPNDADARYNRGMGRLLTGDMEGGFADYEARLLTTENDVINLGLPADKQLDNSAPLEGERILVHCEQGLGDDIQFFRFLFDLHIRRRPAEILVVTHTATRPFLEAEPFKSIPGLSVIPTGTPLEGRYDRWVALMSLPHKLGLGIGGAGIPAPVAPVIEPERLEKWAYVRDPAKLNVGICWAGNWRHKNDAHRSIALKTFAGLFDVEGVNFVSLQQLRPDETDLATQLKNEQDINFYYFDDLRDTAAAISHLDLVISVDTAIAHLSATLSVATSILVPAFGTDWRWMLGREDSPWYSKARLYRQPKVGDWASVITRLRNELAAAAAAQTHAA